MVKKAIAQIVGKRISAVVVKEGHAPDWQLFLVFDDDSSYEIYGRGGLATASGVDLGGIEAVRRYFQETHKIIFEVVLDDPETEAADVN